MQATTAQTYNHFFFGQTDEHLLATHPSLKKRILRLEPRWDGQFIAPVRLDLEVPAVDQSIIFSKEAVVKAITTGATIATGLTSIIEPPTKISYTQAPLVKIAALCQEPKGACHLVFAFLLDASVGNLAKRISLIKYKALLDICSELLAAIPKAQHIFFIEQAIVAIKTLSTEQYQQFKMIMMQLISEDNDISLREWLIFQLVTHQIEYSAPCEVTYHSLEQLKEEITILLFAMAYLSPTESTIKSFFGMGANSMGLYTIDLLSKPFVSELSSSLQKLQLASDTVRTKFLLGILRAIQQDQQVNIKEAMFFRILSICLDYPMAIPDCPVH